MFVTEVVHLDKQFVIVLVKQFEGLHSICNDMKCFFFEVVHVQEQFEVLLVKQVEGFLK